MDLEFEDSKRKIFLTDVEDFLFQGKTFLIWSGRKRVQIEMKGDCILKIIRVESTEKKGGYDVY